MIISDKTIQRRKPLSPIHPKTVHEGCSFGLSSAGYDIRLAQDIVLWPGRYMLASAVEEFDMPLDLVGIVHDKSTWARRGVTVQNTVIEPGWKGYLTLEIRMNAWRVLHIKAGTGIAQVVFHAMNEYPDNAYSGKYQNQEAGPQKARYEK